MNTLFFMTAAAVFIVGFFLAVIVIVANLKNWASKRDEYYHEYFKTLENGQKKVMSEIEKLLMELQTKIN